MCVCCILLVDYVSYRNLYDTLKAIKDKHHFVQYFTTDITACCFDGLADNVNVVLPCFSFLAPSFWHNIDTYIMKLSSSNF